MLRCALTALALLGAALVPAAAGVSAQSSPTAWQPGPNASGDNTYVGNIDAPANGATLPANRIGSISGWFVDTTAQGWAGADDVQVFVGTLDGGGTMVARATPGLDRPDVAATLGNAQWSSAGWSTALDPGALPAGGQVTLNVYVHTPGKGWWFSQVSVSVGASAPLQGDPPTVSVSAPLTNENVSTRLGTYLITGKANDPLKGPRGVDWVEVWLNGEQNADGARFLGNVQPDPDGSWQLAFSPEALKPIPSNLYVYVHSAVTGKRSLTLVHFNLVDRPI